MGMILISCRYVIHYGFVRVYNQARDGIDLYPSQRLFFDGNANPSSFPIEITKRINLKKYYETLGE